jgi:hypothetical protein
MTRQPRNAAKSRAAAAGQRQGKSCDGAVVGAKEWRSEELRNQYIVGYRSSNKSHDARWRKIKIKLRAPKGLPPLSVYAKTGYYAPSL